MERTISFMNGEGSIGHNTRRFIADNVDASRTKDNITLIHEDIKQAWIMRYTYLDLIEEVLRSEKREMTLGEIWEVAEEKPFFVTVFEHCIFQGVVKK